MDYEGLTDAVIAALGGKDNILSVMNCMTRLRVTLGDPGKADTEALKKIEGVLGVVSDREDYYEVVLGPGVVKQCADICVKRGIGSAEPDWRENKKAFREKHKGGALKAGLKTFGDIFIPLIPGVIAAGLCGGLSILLEQAYPGHKDIRWLETLIQLMKLINAAFMTYLTAWAGYRAAEKFGGTPILGGMLGMITGLEGINTVSEIWGLFNTSEPLTSVLRSGRGGVLSAVFGVWLMVCIEKWLRKRMPSALDVIITPLILLLGFCIPYIFIVMPLMGYVSNGICWVVEQVCMSDSVAIRTVAGYVSAALFLPMVSVGMHHGLVALYTVQLNTLGYVTLYPALAMAGAGQVGASIALWIKARRVKNTRLSRVIAGALPAGFLGVGEPLIYGVTLPLGTPFITAGLGAGFGGAFIMAMEVAATTWGPSGLLGLFVMTGGPNPAAKSLLCYLTGLIISYIMGFIITTLVIKKEELTEE
ncbi:MAG: PTS transporter subunit EIIC [Abditibacteriota bacterium]|nr:PTS transporter subunit EIIC [Abditibacteriota bacterium]